MNLTTIFDNTKKLAVAKSPEICAGLAVAGVVATGYFAVKGSFRAAKMIRKNEKKDPTVEQLSDKQLFVRRVRLTWPCYIPAATAGGLTIVAIVCTRNIGSRRTAAAVTAYSLTERAFSEYREKVIEQIGSNKEQKIRDEIVQSRIAANPPGETVILTSTGDVLCCELRTGRYFKSQMETLRRAMNDTNARIISSLYVTLEEFYDLIDIPHTSESNNLGWESSKLMELNFTSVLTQDGVPCLAFDYNYVKPLH